MKQRTTYNPKRRVRNLPQNNEDVLFLNNLSLAATYRGNPEHKKNPGDFDLTPPSSNGDRVDKSLCDGTGIFKVAEAEALLKLAIREGFVSVQFRGDWPQNVWLVTDDGHPLEAQLSNQAIGQYHAYPLEIADPFRDVILNRWENR
jgi:hypothetical protein